MIWYCSSLNYPEMFTLLLEDRDPIQSGDQSRGHMMSNPRKYYLPVVLPSTLVDEDYYAGTTKTPEWEQWPTLGEIRETVKQLRDNGCDTPYSGVDNVAYETVSEDEDDEVSGAEDDSDEVSGAEDDSDRDDGTLDTPQKSVF